MTDKILANSGQNYGVWKMQDWKMTDNINYDVFLLTFSTDDIQGGFFLASTTPSRAMHALMRLYVILKIYLFLGLHISTPRFRRCKSAMLSTVTFCRCVKKLKKFG